MGASAETTVAPGDHVVSAQTASKALDALRYDFRMLDDIGRVRNYARDQDLARRQLRQLPHSVFVLVPRVGAFDEVGLRLDTQHEVDDVLQLDIECVRAVPA